MSELRCFKEVCTDQSEDYSYCTVRESSPRVNDERLERGNGSLKAVGACHPRMLSCTSRQGSINCFSKAIPSLAYP